MFPIFYFSMLRQESVLSFGFVPLVLVTFDKSDTFSHFEKLWEEFLWQVYLIKQLLTKFSFFLGHCNWIWLHQKFDSKVSYTSHTHSWPEL